MILSVEYDVKSRREILYVTERAVFRLLENGMELIAIAPGIDLQRDIFEKMEFVPIISENLRTMDSSIFIDRPMGLIAKFE